MQTKKRPGLIFLFILITMAFTTAGLAAVPGQINYQGRLTNGFTPVPDDTYTMRFYLFDAETGGSQLWNSPDGEEQSVDVEGGIYTVQLGAVKPLDNRIFDKGTAWLEVAVYNPETSTWETLSPRQPVTSVAYALKAGDADTLEGSAANAFASAGHNHDTAYVNEGQANSVSSAMIGTGAVNSSDIADNSLTAADLATDSVGAAEIAPNSVGTSEVIDNSLTAADLAANSVGSSEIATGAVGSSEIRWSIDYTDSDLNGGILSLTNSSNATYGNFPMAISGAISGTPTYNPVIGVFGGAPGLGQGAPVGLFPKTKIGIGGASDTGDGVAGVSTSGYGIYGRSSSNYAGYFTSEYTFGRGVYGIASNTGNYVNYGGYFSAAGSGGRGVYGTATGSSGYGIYGYSTNGDGIYGGTGAADEHAGSFYTNVGVGLAGAALYTRTYNSTGNGIALWAHNDNSASTDVTAVLSNDGTGPLLKGFGGNGGEDEFRFDNDGTLHLYNGNHKETVMIDPIPGGKINLYNDSGNNTVEFFGDYYNYGHILLNNTNSNYHSLTLSGGAHYGAAAIWLKNVDGSNTVSIYGDYYGTGDGRVVTDELQITGGSDLSEQFDIKPTEFEIAPGMVVSIDPEAPGHLKVSQAAYDKKVAGIVSGAGGIKTGMMMGQIGTEADGRHPVALTGRVYCWADTSSGPIQPGDLLTTSLQPGHAMKVTDYTKANGAVLGKAMTALKDGKGLVLVLVSLQ